MVLEMRSPESVNRRDLWLDVEGGVGSAPKLRKGVVKGVLNRFGNSFLGPTYTLNEEMRRKGVQNIGE